MKRFVVLCTALYMWPCYSAQDWLRQNIFRKSNTASIFLSLEGNFQNRKVEAVIADLRFEGHLLNSNFPSFPKYNMIGEIPSPLFQ